MDKDFRKVAKALEARGFVVGVTRKGHPIVHKDGAFVTTCSGTPGDVRALRNFIAACRRAGFVWPPKQR